MTLCSPSPLRLRPLEISEDVRATLMLLGLEYVWDSTNNVYLEVFNRGYRKANRAQRARH